MMIINQPEQLQEVQCDRCKRILKVHPMNNMNSNYFTNCDLHMTAEVIIDVCSPIYDLKEDL